MLQRAAKNAYSWWWASHIRTKQSKWLDQNIRDMEEKVDYILKIIDGDGDSFGKRAEMYYRKRPELLNFVEDTFRSYRALAERYDHLSRDLQTANRTIATVCPERVPMSMYDEDGEIFPAAAAAGAPPKQWRNDLPAPPKLDIPKILSMMKKSDNKPSKMMMSKKGLLKFNADSNDGNAISSSGLSKDEALGKIDKLQKQILGVQTEKEFVKSSYERQLAKYWDFEDQIAEMQAKVNSLQDEFGIGTNIEDDEARDLMTSTALKSCQDTLAQLQEQNALSNEAAEIESQKVQNAKLKFESLVEAIMTKHPSFKHSLSFNPNEEPKKLDQRMESSTRDKEDTQSHLTVSELAERVDGAVEKVISLEISASSQNAYINRLKKEADGLLVHLQKLEEEKETLMGDSENNNNNDNMSKKIRELEEKLQRVMNLDQTINNQKNYLQTQMSEATSTIDDLSVKLVNVVPDEEANDSSSSSEAAGDLDVDSHKSKDGNESTRSRSPDVDFPDLLMEDPLSTIDDKENVFDSPTKPRKSVNFADSVSAVLGRVETGKKLQTDDFPDQGTSSDKTEQGEKFKNSGDQDQEKPEDPRTQVEGEEVDEEYDHQPNWRELFINCLDEREKVLLEEYITALRNYKEAKKKFNEAEKKRRASHFQYVIQIKMLKNSNALKDAEIQSLKKKLNSVQGSHENATKSSSEATHVDSLDVHMKSLLQLIDVPSIEELAKPSEEMTMISKTKRDDDEGDFKLPNLEEPQTFSSIEEKIRMDIDELLEENIELWLRFSNAFHQMEKFQKTVKDLEAELQKVWEKNKQESGKPPSILSEVRPIYGHMGEIQTELMLWLEHTAVLKEDLKHRLSSLSYTQDEVSRLSTTAGTKDEEIQLTAFQAAKFHGEILNMKQENKKLVTELQAGVDCVLKLQADVMKTLSKLDKELGIKEITATTNSKIPVKSFLFGMKLKKQMPSAAIFNPALIQKRVIDLPKLK